jgi:protein O-mannosyl-transferase
MADLPPARSTLLLLALVGAAWMPALAGEFQFDDLANIVFDPATAGGAPLLERLGNGFRPLLRLSYALDHLLWGFVPAGFIATNLALHALTALGVAALARHRLGGGEIAAFAAAAIFALQPAHAAVIASASGRSTGLATLLMVVALLAHERGVAGARGMRFLALACMTLAVLAKETALALPALLILWEITRAAPAAPREVVRRVAPACGLALVLLALALATSSRLREILGFSFALASPLEALALHAAALPISLSLWFRPWALSIEHPHVFAPSTMIAGAVVLAMVIVAALASRRRWPLAMLALLWPLAVLLPTHGFIARLDPIVEKALYPAWIGPSLAFAAGLVALRGSWPRIAPALAPAMLVLAFALCAWRASLWADPAALWREASEKAPWSARAWSNRAVAELGAGRAAAAESAVARALQLDPNAPAAHEVARAISLAAPPTKETSP